VLYLVVSRNTGNTVAAAPFLRLGNFFASPAAGPTEATIEGFVRGTAFSSSPSQLILLTSLLKKPS
jgi:hypothetical protein